MKIHLNKSTREVHEVADDAPDPQLPWEAMSVAAFVEWRAAQPPPPPAPEPVPESVSRRQLKEWLIRNGLLDTVEAIIAGIPDATERRIAQNWWAESIEFRRDHPLVAAIAGVIGKTSAEVDEIFREAAAL